MDKEVSEDTCSRDKLARQSKNYMPEFGARHPSLVCPRIHATLPVRAGQGVLRAPLPVMETTARLARGEAERDDPTNGQIAKTTGSRVRR